MIAMSNYASRVLDQPPHLTDVVSRPAPERSAIFSRTRP